MAKRKRKVSSKVLTALARGRAKLKSLHRQGRKISKGMKKKPFYFSGKKHRKRARRKVSYVPPSKEPLIITKGDCMSGRGRRRHHRKASGPYGFEGRKRSHRRRGHRRYYGADRTSPFNTVINGAVAVGGGVLASMASHYVPVTNAKLKALVPVAIGAVLAMLPMTRRNKMLQSAALGAVVVGGMSLVRQFAPNVPLLTGDLYQGTEYFIPSQGEESAMLGAPYQVAGDNLDGEMSELMGLNY